MKIKAILIDAVAREVRGVEYEGDNLKEMYALLKCETLTSTFCEGMHGKDVMFLDDEGLLKAEVKHAFIWDDRLLAGNALIVGGGNCGESVDAETTVDEVQGRILFSPEGWMLTEEEREKLCRWSIIGFDIL